MLLHVIGEAQTVLGLRLAGVSGVAVADRESALAAFNDAVARQDAGIVLVSESIADLIRAEIDAFVFGRGFPLVIEIPGASGPSPSRVQISDVVRKAIGVSL